MVLTTVIVAVAIWQYGARLERRREVLG